MSQSANVSSIDAIKNFRAALIKFAQAGNVALAAGESDIDRTLGWLERDQTVYWAGQLRKRHEEVIRCEDAVRQKRIFKAPDGSTQSVVDEQKALQKARLRREEAEQKTIAVKRAIQLLHKEAMLYKGRIQGLATVLAADIPKAVHQLDGMLDHLDAYLAVQVSGGGLPVMDTVESFAKALASGPKFGYERLRDETPSAEERAAAPIAAVASVDSPFENWGVMVLNDWQEQALAKLAIDRVMVDPEQRVVVSSGAWKEPRIYLQRQAPAVEGDSGWYLGAVDRSDGEPPLLEAIRAGDLIAAQPKLAQLLGLPVEFLVVLDTAGPVAILDPAGIDLWAIALANSDEGRAGSS